MLNQAFTVACFLVSFLLVASCNNNDDAAVERNRRALQDFKESQVIERRSNSSLLTGSVVKILPGRELYDQKTMLIVVDKGSANGIRFGDSGYFRIHVQVDARQVNLVNQFRAVAVTEDTATMEGWYIPYAPIREHDRVVLAVGPEPSQETLFKFFDQEGIQSPTLKMQ